jgi:hypothetical protein
MNAASNSDLLGHVSPAVAQCKQLEAEEAPISGQCTAWLSYKELEGMFPCPPQSSFIK